MSSLQLIFWLSSIQLIFDCPINSVFWLCVIQLTFWLSSIQLIFDCPLHSLFLFLTVQYTAKFLLSSEYTSNFWLSTIQLMYCLWTDLHSVNFCMVLGLSCLDRLLSHLWTCLSVISVFFVTSFKDNFTF